MDFNKQDKEYPKCPAGIHNAVCVDIVDKGWVPVTYEGKTSIKPKVTVVFQTEDRNDYGLRHNAYLGLTVSTSKKGNMYKYFSSWIGDELLNGEFNPESLVGRPATINVTHQPGQEGGVFVKVESVTPKHPKDDALEPEDYIRKKDRNDWVAPQKSAWAQDDDTAAPAPVAPAQQPAPAAAPATPAATEITPPAATEAATLSPEQVAEFQEYFMTTFNPMFAMKKLEEFCKQVSGQTDFRKLRPHQLASVKFQLNQLEMKYWAAKPIPRAEATETKLNELDELGEDPFENE